MEQGLGCYNDYKVCLADQSDKIDGEILPAKLFYKLMCEDEDFKSDFMKHRDCFKHAEKVSWRLYLALNCLRQICANSAN